MEIGDKDANQLKSQTLPACLTYQLPKNHVLRPNSFVALDNFTNMKSFIVSYGVYKKVLNTKNTKTAANYLPFFLFLCTSRNLVG